MCVTLMRWLVAILSFATDRFLVLAVAKSSSATVATDQLQVAQPSQPTSFAVATLSIATDHMAIASSQPSQPSQPIMLRLRSSASQPSQPSQPTKSSWLRRLFCIRRNHRNRSTTRVLNYLELSEMKKVYAGLTSCGRRQEPQRKTLLTWPREYR